MSRVLSSELNKFIDQSVLLQGRVYALRKMGAICFLILQDRDGLIQVVFEQPIKANIGAIVYI
jgi:aspartyl/asparaginyl-tRNA synthetase